MQQTNLTAKLPAYTKSILAALNSAGYAAYLVGGAVRDLLLGLTPDDYDITTSARPEQVLAVCKSQGWQTVDKLGHNFGCVVIVIDGTPTEVTTFRGERYGDGDMHRPAATWYCDTLREDLSRRDFTVNALALDADGKLYDYFGGVSDLYKKILRTVGNARQRYTEDALRMLRACRFVAQLGFTYVEEGAEALPQFGQVGTPYFLPHSFDFPVARISGLSLERVRREIERLLVSKNAGHGLMLMMATGILQQSCHVRENGQDSNIPLLPEAQHLVGLPQNPRFHLYNTWEHTLLAIDNSPRELVIRWALVLHDLGKGLPHIRKLNKEGQPSDPGHEAESAVMAKDILTRLRYPKEFVHLVTWLVAQHMRFAPMLWTGERTLLRWVRNEAVHAGFHSEAALAKAYTMLVEVFLADMGATHARENPKLMADGRELGRQVVELARAKMPVTAKDLSISGRELLALLPKGKIKDTLAYLLERVQSGNLPNEQEALHSAVMKYLKRHQEKE